MTHTRRLYHYRSCGYDFPAWLPVAKRPDGAMLLYSHQHYDQVRLYLERMRTRASKTWG